MLQIIDEVKFKKGFTLIELLVVVAIVSLLSSIIFASLNSARAKSKDAAIKAEVNQIRILLEQNFNDYGSYSNLQQSGVWYTVSSGNCSTINQGVYAAQVASICASIISKQPANPNIFHLGTHPSFGNANYYSIMAYLPSKTTFYCVGSSGRNSDTDVGTWLSPGCYSNP